MKIHSLDGLNLTHIGATLLTTTLEESLVFLKQGYVHTATKGIGRANTSLEELHKNYISPIMMSLWYWKTYADSAINYTCVVFLPMDVF